MRNHSERHFRILIVEDHPDTLRLLTRLLLSRGYLTSTATTVAEAVASFDESSPDVVLSDLDLPDGSGIDLIHQLRARGQSVHCIALTGHGLPEHRAQTRAAGFDAHLIKPITFDQLETAIRQAVETPAN